MSDSFAGGLARLNAIAAQYLGWRPHEFWSATPAELHASLANPDASATPALSREHFKHLLERETDG